IPGEGGGSPVVPASSRGGKSGKSVAVAEAEKPHGSSGSLGVPRRAKKKKATYTVQPGDTVWGIARKHNVQPKDLMQWNTAAAKGTLRPGDTLVLAAD
ncbi:MAG: LysM peptidoglycan-binding domain-containing protein, partial [Desulfovibrionaceae bacterium]|nr:LysM peptidoglycan-binding domain-containing protein [Desulfovibrionaceae bacterium]